MRPCRINPRRYLNVERQHHDCGNTAKSLDARKKTIFGFTHSIAP
jgi:hypothetical protein